MGLDHNAIIAQMHVMSETPAASPPREVVTRFAPSPTGRLHIGHAYSALFAWQTARRAGGRFLLRIEDIDAGRCDPAFEAGIHEDLEWLGLDWDGPVLRQSKRLDAYAEALARLKAEGLVYPCFCTRKDIRAEVARMGSAPHGPLGAVYPGTCRGLSPAERARKERAGRAAALRLDVQAALARTGELTWHDQVRGPQPVDLEGVGDVVLARKDIATSYHLAVTVDDAAQGVTLVTRGEDLLEATAVHRVLQGLLDLPVPEWHHHPLQTDEHGRRLAKRDAARSIAGLRAAGHSPAEVRAMAGFPD